MSNPEIPQQSAELKLALVGCGAIAQDHWRGIQQDTHRIKVTAAVDTNPANAARMAEQTGARPFTSLEAALAEGDFAAVDLMLPHHQHESAAGLAFAAGKHVVLEKPMSTTAESSARILDMARRAGTVFMVAEQAQYWPDVVAVQELIRAGAIGRIIAARAFFGMPAPKLTGPKPWRYYAELAGGGICIDGGAHWIRPLRMWLGEIDEAVAGVGRFIPEMEGESMARALLRFQSGVVASFDSLYGGSIMGTGDEFRVTGSAGEIVVEKGLDGRVLLFNQDHPQGETIMTKHAGRMAAFGYELHDFECAVLDGKPLAAGPEYSLGELRTALAIYRSAESRQWEKVWE
jgi:predicted dehydrogenase